jgi:hypothetical protein
VSKRIGVAFIRCFFHPERFYLSTESSWVTRAADTDGRRQDVDWAFVLTVMASGSVVRSCSWDNLMRPSAVWTHRWCATSVVGRVALLTAMRCADPSRYQISFDIKTITINQSKERKYFPGLRGLWKCCCTTTIKCNAATGLVFYGTVFVDITGAYCVYVCARTHRTCKG